MYFKQYSLVQVREGLLKQDEETLRTFGFLSNGFEPDYYYWQICITARKLAATTVITLARPYGLVVQSQLAIAVFVAALCAHVKYMPFKDPIIDTLETSSICSFILTAWLGPLMSLDSNFPRTLSMRPTLNLTLGVLMSLETVPTPWKQGMSIAAVIINASAVLLLLWAFIYEAIAVYRRNKEDIWRKLEYANSLCAGCCGFYEMDNAVVDLQECQGIEMSDASNLTKSQAAEIPHQASRFDGGCEDVPSKHVESTLVVAVDDSTVKYKESHGPYVSDVDISGIAIAVLDTTGSDGSGQGELDYSSNLHETQHEDEDYEEGRG